MTSRFGQQGDRFAARRLKPAPTTACATARMTARTSGRKTERTLERGVSLLEFMASVVVLLVLTSGVFKTLNYAQKIYQRTELNADMHDSVRSAIDLATQEIGQAGL